MAAKKLDWDSQFLGFDVFGVSLDATDRNVDVEDMIRDLSRAGAKLAYIFLQENDPGLQEKKTDLRQALLKNGAILYDEKITFSKAVIQQSVPPPKEIELYEGAASDELLDLAFLAGHESRFKKDPRLLPFFEPLYKLWIVNSLNGIMADRFFVYRHGGSIGGMVTCKIGTDRVGSIPLIATSQPYQGKGVGSGLLQAVEEYYRTNDVTRSTVVTQRSNGQACRFYEKAGFTEYKTEYVYHLWFN